MTDHEKRMQHIKETDPILYYELTNDPTGASSGNAGCGTVCWLVLIILLIVAFHGIF